MAQWPSVDAAYVPTHTVKLALRMFRALCDRRDPLSGCQIQHHKDGMIFYNPYDAWLPVGFIWEGRWMFVGNRWVEGR